MGMKGGGMRIAWRAGQSKPEKKADVRTWWEGGVVWLRGW